MGTETKPARESRSKQKNPLGGAGDIAFLVTIIGITGGALGFAGFLSERSQREHRNWVATNEVSLRYSSLEKSAKRFCEDERLYRELVRRDEIAEIASAVNGHWDGRFTDSTSEIRKALEDDLELYNLEAKSYALTVEAKTDPGFLGTELFGTSLDADVPYVAPSLAEMRQKVCISELDEIIGPTS